MIERVHFTHFTKAGVLVNTSSITWIRFYEEGMTIGTVDGEQIIILDEEEIKAFRRDVLHIDRPAKLEPFPGFYPTTKDTFGLLDEAMPPEGA